MTRRVVTAVLALPTVVLAIAALAGFLGRFAWWLDAIANFRPHLAALSLVVAAACLVTRRRKLAAAAVVAASIHAAVVLPLYLPRGTEPPAGAVPLRVMHLNVHGGTRGYAAVAAAVRASDADLVFLQEGMDEAWVEGLAAAGLGDYELAYRYERSDWRGLAVLARASSRVEVVTCRAIHPLARVPVPMLETVVRVKGVEASLLSIHPPPPTRRFSFEVRNALLAAAGRWAKEQVRPCVVIGDFNATPWSTGFRGLMREGGLLNSQRGYGVAGTWSPRGLEWLRIPIDHCVHSESVTTLDRHVGDDAGSDHLPLHVTLAIPRPSPGK